ncbi:hypothetical protein CYY_004176 [Polysphondylium violaceum]|uniref:Transmembrane protein n=1 Tax=Polysphondylium violaceum TaxID=133409 RepID=A0A8J4PTP8_9MYCE|nr:hypothetical protein CYY_004176 [Polysphondylium violaceum]
MTDEERKALEERRREARKNRIQNGSNKRLGFIASHITSEDLNKPEEPVITNTPSTPPTTDEVVANNNNNNNNNSFNFNNVTQRNRYIDDLPISFTILRWTGILFFACIYFANAVLLCTPELLNANDNIAVNSKGARIFNTYKWIFESLTSMSGGKVSARQFMYVYIPVFMVWLLWEYILVFNNRSHQSVRSKTFLSFARSDGLLIGFFYTVFIDLLLRFGYMALDNETYAMIINKNTPYLIQSLYYPLIVAIIGQYVINQIPKQFPIIQMNHTFSSIFTGVSNFALSIIILLLFIDWWSCTTCYCQPLGLLWIISSQSRGLLLWSHICINFASRLF